MSSDPAIHLPVHAAHVAPGHGVAAVGADATEMLDLLSGRTCPEGKRARPCIDEQEFQSNPTEEETNASSSTGVCVSVYVCVSGCAHLCLVSERLVEL